MRTMMIAIVMGLGLAGCSSPQAPAASPATVSLRMPTIELVPVSRVFGFEPPDWTWTRKDIAASVSGGTDIGESLFAKCSVTGYPSTAVFFFNGEALDFMVIEIPAGASLNGRFLGLRERIAAHHGRPSFEGGGMEMAVWHLPGCRIALGDRDGTLLLRYLQPEAP